MRLHEITGMLLEDGHGAHPDHVQAARHCDLIEKQGNKSRADELRKQLGIQTAEEVVAAKTENENEHKALQAEVGDLTRRIAELEQGLSSASNNHADHGTRLTELEHHVARLTRSLARKGADENAATAE